MIPHSVIPSEYLFVLKEIDKSPIVVTILSDITVADTTECQGDGLVYAFSGTISSFSCCPRDRYSNLRDDNNSTSLASELLSSSLRYLGNLPPIVTHPDTINVKSMYDVLTHCFNYEYVPQRGGILELDVTYQNSYTDVKYQIAGSPFSVFVDSNPVTNSEMSQIFGKDISSPINLFVAGNCYNFTIVARDEFGSLILAGGIFFEV